MVLWLKDPTPGSFKFAKAPPTSAWVTPSFILRCLNLSANASNSRGSHSLSCIGWWTWWWGGMLWCGFIGGGWLYMGWYIWWGLWWPLDAPMLWWSGIPGSCIPVFAVNWSSIESEGGPNGPWPCIFICGLAGPVLCIPRSPAVWPYSPSCFIICWGDFEMSTAANASALARRPSSNPPKKLPCNRQRKVYSKICVKSPGVCVGGGGGVLWYFHTYVGSGHFFGSKFWNSIFLGVFRKINIFWGMKISWIFLGVIKKLDYMYI